MNNNRIIKGLLVALMLNCATTPLQADWLAPIRNFFNNPTKEKLIVSCALAGISLLTAGTAFYCYRGLGKLYEAQKKEKQTLLAQNGRLKEKLKTATREISELLDQSSDSDSDSSEDDSSDDDNEYAPYATSIHISIPSQARCGTPAAQATPMPETENFGSAGRGQVRCITPIKLQAIKQQALLDLLSH